MIDKIKRIKTNKRCKHISHSVDLSIVRISTGKIHSKLARLFPEGSTKIWNSHHRCFHLIRCFIKSKSCFLSFCHIFFFIFYYIKIGVPLADGPNKQESLQNVICQIKTLGKYSLLSKPKIFLIFFFSHSVVIIEKKGTRVNTTHLILNLDFIASMYQIYYFHSCMPWGLSKREIALGSWKVTKGMSCLLKITL